MPHARHPAHLSRVNTYSLEIPHLLIVSSSVWTPLSVLLEHQFSNRLFYSSSQLWTYTRKQSPGVRSARASRKSHETFVLLSGPKQASRTRRKLARKICAIQECAST